jgi:hypothetical protein
VADRFDLWPPGPPLTLKVTYRDGTVCRSTYPTSCGGSRNRARDDVRTRTRPTRRWQSEAAA